MRFRIGMIALATGAALALSAAGGASADTYSYDALGRLVQVVTSGGTTITYTYDKAGNRTAMTVQ